MPKPRATKARLDEILVQRGLADDVAHAKRLVMAGLVVVDDRRHDKAGERIPVTAAVRLKGSSRSYVSRGGDKLVGALDAFPLSVDDTVCLDVGASTGGFTDALLDRGARLVYAVDVAYGMLATKLRQDPRVVVLERCNARTLDRALVPEPVDLLVADVSFISLAALLPTLVPLLGPGAQAVLLVKPQFELPRHLVPDGGVVTDDTHRRQAADDVAAAAGALGLVERGRIDSPVTGPAGNREILSWLSLESSES